MANYDFTYTGAEIQAILDTAKKLKDSGYIFLGVATPSTNPGTPTQKVYYEAKQAGTYTNFGGVVLPDGISMLIWNGSWTSETVMCGDGGVFDISVYKSSGGTLAKYADLAAALDGGNNIPVGVRKGGVSVKYVQSSDNKYVQFRLMADSFSTTVTDWQGVDKDPTAGSKNLVESGGVFEYTDVNFPKLGNNPNSDLNITDEHNNILVEFGNGEVKTKNFDSAKTPNIDENVSKVDLSFTDSNNNSIVDFIDGGIRTKFFDSRKFNGKYAKKKISIFGDSISTFGTPDSRNENGTYCWSYYPTQTCRYSELGNVTEGGSTFDSIKFDVVNTWWMRVIHSFGAILGVNDSWRGCKVSGSAMSSFCNQDRIDHLGANGNPDLILVYAGTNDAGNAVTIGTFETTPPPTTAEGVAALGNTTFAEAYRTMLIRLMFKYPFAEIVVILPTFTATYYTIAELDSYVEIIKEACDFFGIKYIDARCSGINYYNKEIYLVDGIHPNSKGMELLANKIQKQIIFT